MDPTSVVTLDPLVAIVAAVLAALPPTIAALAALRQGKQNAAKVAVNTQLTEDTGHKTDNLIKKTDEIHELTNSNLTSVKSDLAMANQRIKELQLLVEDLAKGPSETGSQDNG